MSKKVIIEIRNSVPESISRCHFWNFDRFRIYSRPRAKIFEHELIFFNELFNRSRLNYVSPRHLFEVEDYKSLPKFERLRLRKIQPQK